MNLILPTVAEEEYSLATRFPAGVIIVYWIMKLQKYFQ